MEVGLVAHVTIHAKMTHLQLFVLVNYFNVEYKYKGGCTMNAKSIGNVADGIVLTTSTLFSLTDIENALSIAILIVNVIYVVVKSVLSIIQKIKDKKYQDAVEEINNLKKELVEQKNYISGGDDNGK